MPCKGQTEGTSRRPDFTQYALDGDPCRALSDVTMKVKGVGCDDAGTSVLWCCQRLAPLAGVVARALPWAGMFGPFGSRKVETSQHQNLRFGLALRTARMKSLRN